MKKIFGVVLVIILFCLSTRFVSAQVINEFSPKGDPEWVELYNNTSNTVDLTGWTITDGANHVKNISGSIVASGYFIYENPSGWLNDTGGDSIILKNSSNNIIDSIDYGTGSILTPDSGMCSARTPDGSSVWTSNISCSKNGANPSAPTATPTPTVTAAPTSVPTAVPTATPFKTATPAPTKTPQPTPKATAGNATPTDTAIPDATPDTTGTVLSASDEPSSDPSVNTDAKPKFPFIAVGVILIGLGFLGFAFWPLIVAKLHHAS